MEIRALSRFLPLSPYKLRPIADVIRGKNVLEALSWLKTYSQRRTHPISKAVFSAYSNAKQLNNALAMNALRIKEIRIDQGPTKRYFKPTAMGRASMQRRRYSHIVVVVEPIEIKVSKQSNSEVV